MNNVLLPGSACAQALEAILKDPLDPGAQTEAHLRLCLPCAEARVAFLAQEETPEALAPAGYHDRLPARVVGKLPAQPSLGHRMGLLAWTAAAALLMAVGAGAFWAGRANRTPYVEASLPRQPDFLGSAPGEPDTPFHDHEEDAAQIQSLSPEEMRDLLKQLKQSPPPK